MKSSYTRRKKHSNRPRRGGGLSPLTPGPSKSPKSRKIHKKVKVNMERLDIEEYPLRYVTTKKNITKFSVLQERARQQREEAKKEKERQMALKSRIDHFLAVTPLGRDKKKRHTAKIVFM